MERERYIEQKGNIFIERMRSRCLDKPMDKLIPRLRKMKRGDSLPPEEVRAICGETYERMRDRIRGFFWSQNMTVTHRDGIMFVMTDEEQVHNTTKRMKRVRTQIGNGIKELGGVDKSQISEQTMASMPLIAQQLASVGDVATAAARVLSRALGCALKPTKRLPTGA